MSAPGPSRSNTASTSTGISTDVPNSLSTVYWSTWSPVRKGASVTESLERSDGEEWIGGWGDIGLYEGNEKIPSYQSLSVHLTTHRLILIPDPPSSSTSSSSTPAQVPLSLQTHLSHVRQTEFYTGFMRSSPKITLTLGPPPSLPSSVAPATASAASNTNADTDSLRASSANGSGLGENSSWTCGVCGYANTTTLGRVSATSRCGLCGVPYSTSQQASASGPPSRSSTPTIFTATSASTASALSESMATPMPSAHPPDPTVRDSIACPACTFLNSPLLPNCEICSTPLPGSTARRNTAKRQDSLRAEMGKTQIIRLSFRDKKGGVNDAYKKLKSVLGDKAWERGVGVGGSRDSQNGDRKDGDGSQTPSRSGAGIDGILQTMDINAKSRNQHMKSAFADLDALMLRAGEMVRLAQSLNAKLTSQQQAASSGGGIQPSEEEATMIRTSLVQLGLAAPALTQDMVRDERKYHEGLAKELGELLTGRFSREVAQGKTEGLMLGSQGRGVIGLDEVWGLWMRARGVALLSPSTLISILPYIPANTSPSIQSSILPSSLQVLHTPTYSTPAILSRTLDRLNPGRNQSTEVEQDVAAAAAAEQSFSLLEFASFESLPIGLAKEFIELMEKEGGLVKDEQAPAGEGGVRWYRDIISYWPVI
ncbi:ESCRT-II complex subunit VPS36 [Kwoniella heveanensis BCC8398]|uniref:Vacuolar protein-sorting-associated protein 36 n=1 Tax=Kwoniella heveanensis BCC8398 TaxID=1296120 RepID=A0A1B9H097_9TREE|nr:ESCRT-II complex subunit VPS36 [Kwoniella heveanensis BCC8398]